MSLDDYTDAELAELDRLGVQVEPMWEHDDNDRSWADAGE